MRVSGEKKDLRSQTDRDPSNPLILNGMAERVGFEPGPYSRCLKIKRRALISNIFIFLSAVYYVYPFSLVSPVLAQNRHQIDTKVAERPALSAKVRLCFLVSIWCLFDSREPSCR